MKTLDLKLNGLYLKLQKCHGFMERKQNSKIMLMTVDSFLPKNSIIPIAIDNYIISECKVVDSNIFQSKLKIILNSDSNIIPQFDVMNIEPNTKLKDVRPCNISMLKIAIPDLLDYSGLQNLQLNVRFRC